MTHAEKFINDSSNTLNEHQRQMLRDLSTAHPDNTYLKENRQLEEYVEVLRDMYPEKFHRTRGDLESRVFFDAPTSMATPHARCVRPREQSPYTKGRK